MSNIKEIANTALVDFGISRNSVAQSVTENSIVFYFFNKKDMDKISLPETFKEVKIEKKFIGELSLVI